MLAFVFPGQGAQRVGMGKELVEQRAEAKEVFLAADEALGFPLSQLCLEGPEEELQQTANTQPAVLTMSLAVLAVLEQETELVPDVVAGHSLGEYSALVCAGAIVFEDAVRLVHKRGVYMQEAVPQGEGAMAAIMGIDVPSVEALCREVAEGRVVFPANYNGPSQTVVAGHAVAVNRVVELALQRGAAAKTLKVSAPFHCELMEPAAAKLASQLRQTRFADPRFPVIANVDAEPNSDASNFADLLERQVCAPVRWEECVRKMAELGVTTVLEIGCGDTLTKLMGRIDKALKASSVETVSDIGKLAERGKTDLECYQRWWREGGWRVRKDGVKINRDGTHLILPGGYEWRWDDPGAHGF